MAMYRNAGFVMIPENNDELWSKDKRFNIVHSYILERTRNLNNQGLPCFISNSQFANELGFSERTVTRAIKLLVDKKVLWAAYNQESNTNKQRVLWVYDEAKAKKEKSPKLGLNPSQNDNLPVPTCQPPVVTMASGDSQNDVLVYKNILKEDKIIDNYNNIDKNNENDLFFDIGECDYDENVYCTTDECIEYNSVTLGHPTSFETDADGSNWENYFSLSDAEREEIIEDIEMDLISERDIPLWYRKRQEIMERWLKKLDYGSVDEMSAFFQAAFLGRVRSDLEDTLRGTCAEEAIA